MYLFAALTGILFGFVFADTRYFGGERIVGGVDTTIKEFPYQISFRKNGRHSCGGSIYSQNVIITAAHCVQNVQSLQNLTVVAGATNRDSGGIVKQVERFKIHPGYSTLPTNNDVALLFLTTPLSYTPSVQPISLPAPNEIIRAGTKALVSGWGALKEGGSSPDTLQYVAVNIVSNEECANSYGSEQITPQMICAGEPFGGKDSCQGDSGGPLVVSKKLIGIVSWGSGCARPGYPGVYAKVSVLRSWIQNAIEQ